MVYFPENHIKGYKQKKRFSYLSKLEAGALVKTFLFHKPNLALFSSYFSQGKQHNLFGKFPI